jgi:hypothetical protein
MSSRSIRATFSHGAVKEINLSESLAAGGVFEPSARDRGVFEGVHINPETRTVEWPGEVDLDPEVLYGLHEPASSHRIGRKTVREPPRAAS